MKKPSLMELQAAAAQLEESPAWLDFVPGLHELNELRVPLNRIRSLFFAPSTAQQIAEIWTQGHRLDRDVTLKELARLALAFGWDPSATDVRKLRDGEVVCLCTVWCAINDVEPFQWLPFDNALIETALMRAAKGRARYVHTPELYGIDPDLLDDLIGRDILPASALNGVHRETFDRVSGLLPAARWENIHTTDTEDLPADRHDWRGEIRESEGDPYDGRFDEYGEGPEQQEEDLDAWRRPVAFEG
jgi:hypothetical protein